MAENQVIINKKQIGRSGIEVFSNRYTDDYFAQGNPCSDIVDLFKKMSDDPQCRKILQAIKSPIRSANWSIDLVLETPENEKIKELLENILFNDISWKEKLGEILTFLDQGHSLFEPVIENKTRDVLYTGLSALAWRAPESITEWEHDPQTGLLKRIRQEQQGDVAIDVWIPAENLIFFFNEKMGDNNGTSLLRYVYEPWRRKQLTHRMKMIGIERLSLGVPTMKIPETVRSESQEFKDVVSVIQKFTNGENSYFVIPQNYDLNLWNNTGYDPGNLETSVKRENEEMSGTILASFLELGTGGNGGAYALGDNLEKIFTRGISFYADYIASIINARLIPALIGLNFNKVPDVYPRLIHTGISERSGKEFMEIITGFKNAGLINPSFVDEEFIREKFNMPKAEEPEKKEKEEILPKEDDEDSDDDDDDSPDENKPENQEEQKEDVVDEQKKDDKSSGMEDSLSDIYLSMDMADARQLSSFVFNTRKTIKDNVDILATIMSEEVSIIGAKIVKKIVDRFQKLSKASRLNAIDNLNTSSAGLRKAILDNLSEVALKADRDVRKEIPIHNKSMASAFDSLPKSVQKMLRKQSKRISERTTNDLEDAVVFQFMSSNRTTNDFEVIKQDLQDVVSVKSGKGRMKVKAATATSVIVNEARMNFLLTPEVTEKVYAFVFVNTDPISAICKRLAGRVFKVNDRAFLAYSPPLHPNCKSFLSAIPKIAKRKPKIQGLPPITEVQKKSIKF